MRGSVRLRLSLFYGGLLTFVLVVFSSGVYLMFRRQLYRALDSDLLANARGAEHLLRRELHEPPEVGGATGSASLKRVFTAGDFEGLDIVATDIFLQLVGPDGQTLQRSPNLADRSLIHTVHSLRRGPTLVTKEHPTLGRLRECLHGVSVAGQTYWVAVAEPLAPLDKALAELWRLFALFLPGAVLLVGGGGYLLAGRALAPVDAVIRTARAIRAGDLSRRIGLQGPADELKNLADELDEMLAALESLVQTQRRFAADASHELRTPLTVIDSCAQVHLRVPEPTVDELRDALVAIRDETQRMKRLVADLLTLARADAGEEKLSLESVDLAALLRRVQENTAWLTTQHTVRVEVEPGMRVRGDPDRLQQLLLNLVDNAVKHTPAGGTIALFARRQGKNAACGVRDTGSGVPPEHLPHPPPRFYRVDKARSREQGGSGLGLAICKWIAEAHGGRIEVHSVVGQGTCFTVILPERPSN